jgi:hypothetical protein
MSMINLMPPAHKETISYARKNTYLVSWLIGVIIAALGVVLVAGGGLYYLRADVTAYNKSAEATSVILKSQDQEEIINRVSELSGNLKLVVDVLSSEVLFSKLITEIGNIMPPGTVLAGLTLDSKLVGGIDLAILATSYESGVQAQINLADPENGIFSRADIGEVRCDFSEPNTYPCSATMRVLFSKDNSTFLKLNQNRGQP